MESSALLIYLVKTIAIQGVFFMFYYLFLRNKTTYGLNRTFLIMALVVSFVVPIVDIPIPQESIVNVPSEILIIEDSEVSESLPLNPELLESNQTNQSFNAEQIILWVYIMLAGLLVIRSVFHLFILQKLKKQSVYVEKKWFRLFKTAQLHPFSFLSNVFIPNKIFGSESYDQILEHECEHVRQRHSVDRLLIDFMAALFWFNPFMYLYRRALIEIHEYQADAAVINKFPDPIAYQEILFSQLKATPYSGLVSHFNFSTIKKRIVMINKLKTKKTAWAYFLAVPVTLMVVLAFANKVPTNRTSIELNEIIEVPPSELVQGDYTPSILPLKETSAMKVSSMYGMRKDPIDKKRKMHRGIDFATPTGTTVLVTADGKVLEAKKDDKYGLMILVQHGDKFKTRYSQLSTFSVKAGDEVKKGEAIAKSGNSGRSTAPHLHYEVQKIGVGYQNPVQFIKNYDFGLPEVVEIPTPPSSNNEQEQARIREEEQQAAEHVQRLKAEEIMMREKLVAEERAMAALREEEQERAVKLMKQAQQAEMEAYERRIEAEEARRMAEIEMNREHQSRIFLEAERMTKDPLYILDGEVIESKDTKNLNVDNIESIEVLKGESAVKAYGSKAKGGVVVIKSKDKNKAKNKAKNKEKLKNKDKK